MQCIVLIKISILIIFILAFCTPVPAGIIFQDNFDSHADWSPTQGKVGEAGGDPGCWKCTDVPTGWTAFENGKSFCDDVGNNTLNIGSTNARNNTGKALTLWDEKCTVGFEDSDGNLGIFFDTIYSEIYVRFYVNFQLNYPWAQTDYPMHKLWHIQYHCGDQAPWSYFGNDCNKPLSVGGLKIHIPTVYYYVAYRCEENYYCNGDPAYVFNGSQNDHDHANLGSWENVFNDGNWHCFELYYKMNTNNGVTFNADGIHRFWVDGELQYESTNIPFSDTGSDQGPRRGWNFFSIGGNNANFLPGDEQSEQWYAVDDVVISTEYIGPDYVIGDPPMTGDVNGDEEVNHQDVDACVNHILGIQDWGEAADVNEDGNVNVLDVQEIVGIILSE